MRSVLSHRVIVVVISGLLVSGAALGSAARVSRLPPSRASLGDVWIRAKDCAAMVYVPAGEFLMGSTDADVDFGLALCNGHSPGCGHCTEPDDLCRRAWFEVEQPAHTVYLDDFWLDEHEVTNSQYQKCVSVGACSPPEKSSLYTLTSYYDDASYEDYPVIHVRWDQGVTYCRWAGGCLPTEAEWEYAARGVRRAMFPWGDEFPEGKVSVATGEFDPDRFLPSDNHPVASPLNHCDINCWYAWRDKTIDDHFATTAPVGGYPDGASWCGASDLAGNVAEWVYDWYDESYYRDSEYSNPRGPVSGDARVVRGGSWGQVPLYAMSSHRSAKNPADANIYVGFRCARDGR